MTSFGPRLSGQDGILVCISFSPLLAGRLCVCLENGNTTWGGGGGRVRQEIAPVLVVESDDDVRDVLHEVLTGAGFEVIEHATDAAALDFLAASSDGMVVLYSNKYADHHRSAAFFAQVVADERFTSRHQYLLLSSNPLLIPPALQTHLTQLNAAILPKPFDIDFLVARVHETAAWLAPVHARTRAG